MILTWRAGQMKLRHILLLSLALRLLTLSCLAILPHLIRPFDTSHLLLDRAHHGTTNVDATTPGTLRWDAIHYASIALNGYEYEQQLAFSPTLPFLMRHSGNLIAWNTGQSGLGVREVVWGGVTLDVLASLGATSVLYHTTSAFSSKRFAAVTALLYTFAPAPAALASAYTEPLYSLCTFAGFHLALRQRFVLASLALAGATSLRATGVFGVGVIGWLLIFPRGIPSPSDLQLQRLLLRAAYAIVLSLVVVAPFVAFQVFAYRSFCLPHATRPWCNNKLPMVYSFVQAEYWNVGWLKYWVTSQLPNLLLALPIIIPSIWGSYRYLRLLFSRTGPEGKISFRDRHHVLKLNSRRAFFAGAPDPDTTNVPMSHALLLPIHLHHLLMTFILVFASHVQIALRVSVTDPVIWWNFASLAFNWQDAQHAPIDTSAKREKPIHPREHQLRFKTGMKQRGKQEQQEGQGEERDGQTGKNMMQMTTFGRLWIAFAIDWGALSIVLWSAHLPPA